MTIRGVKVKELINGGFLHVLFGGTLTKIVFFLSSILIVRIVSKDEYAFLAYADNIYSYIFLICGLGCGSAVLKYCVSDNKVKNKAFLKYALKFGSIFQLVILFITLVAIEFVPIAFPEAKKYILFLGFYPMLYFWIGAVQSFMRARLRTKEFAFAGVIQAIVILTLGTIFAWLWGVSGIISARYIAIIVVIIYSISTIKGDVVGIENDILSKEDKEDFIKFSVALLMANLFSMIMPINESFLVNNIIGDTTISAEYKVANLIPSQLPFFTQAIVTYYFPIFAKLRNKNQIWEKAKSAELLTIIIIISVVAVGMIVSPIIIIVFYGKQYAGITWLMQVMWIMHAVNAGIRMLPLNILPAVGYVKFNLYLSIISCIAHFIIDFFSIYYFGIRGAVVAGITIYMLSGIMYWIYLKRKMRE